MNEFIRIRNGIATEHFITEITEKDVFYGYKLAGHENKKATAMMTIDCFNRLVKNKQIIGEVIV